MWKTFSETYDDDEIPQILPTLDLHGIAKYIESDACENIFIMAGAGISTAAGIPDFRSPNTGLYANLARLKLPYPEAVFDIGFFRRNPRPFYTLAHELAPGKYRPTLTHSFIRLLCDKKLLHTYFTQNIDTLERRAGVPEKKIIEAHGSFAGQHCIDCGATYPDDKMKANIEAQEIARCLRKGCNGLVKPDIVFFGESLPPAFHNSIPQLRRADLLIVMGTSLTVHPFASLTQLVPEDCPRLLLNLDHVGDFGSRPNDVVCLMKCDQAVRELCKLLRWEEELDKCWEETASSIDKPIDLANAPEKQDLKDEVDKLTKEVENTLKLSEAHQEEVKEELKSDEFPDTAEKTNVPRAETLDQIPTNTNSTENAEESRSSKEALQPEDTHDKESENLESGESVKL